MWRNKDLEDVAEIIREMDGLMVNLQEVMGNPTDPELLLLDGLHPSLEGQKRMVAALVERLAEGRGC